MNHKSRFWLVALIASLLVVSSLAPATAQDAPFRVAAVAPSATNDLAFSQSMFDALTTIQEEMGEDNFEFVFQDGTFIVDDAAVALREWAASGDFDLVIAHGSQFGSVLEELAPEFPDVSFAWGTDDNTFGLDNVFAYTAASEEGGYINGFVAGSLTGSGVIGVIGPIEVGDAKLYVDGFMAGAAAASMDVQVNVNYIQSFSDVPLATEAAETHIANGADILTGTAQMVIGPIAVGKEAGTLWFGTQASQAELSENTGVMFQVYHWEVVLSEMIDLIKSGTLGGESYTINLANGGLEMQAGNGFADDRQKQALLERLVAALAADIASGDTVVFGG